MSLFLPSHNFSHTSSSSQIYSISHSNHSPNIFTSPTKNHTTIYYKHIQVLTSVFRFDHSLLQLFIHTLPTSILKFQYNGCQTEMHWLERTSLRRHHRRHDWYPPPQSSSDGWGSREVPCKGPHLLSCCSKVCSPKFPWIFLCFVLQPCLNTCFYLSYLPFPFEIQAPVRNPCHTRIYLEYLLYRDLADGSCPALLYEPRSTYHNTHAFSLFTLLTICKAATKPRLLFITIKTTYHFLHFRLPHLSFTTLTLYHILLRLILTSSLWRPPPLVAPSGTTKQDQISCWWLWMLLLPLPSIGRP